MKSIKFSHVYTKMPPNPDPSMLTEVFPVQVSDLSKEFVVYDTTIKNGGQYKLPNGRVLVLLLKTSEDQIWTTIRRFTTTKCKYYRESRGKRFNIVVKEVDTSLNDYL